MRAIAIALAAALGICVGCADRAPERGAGRREAKATKATASRAQAGAAARDTVWAASSLLRIARGGRVVKGVDLRRTVSDIAFSEDGARAFVAASDGVHLLRVDSGGVATGDTRITDAPARRVDVAGGRVWVLDHTVATGPDGVPVPSSYRLHALGASTLTEEASLDVSDRVLAFTPPYTNRVLLLHESGALRAVRWPDGLGSPIEPPEGGRVRDLVVAPDGKTAYLGVEGPGAAVVGVDLATMTFRPLPLGRAASVRGLAVTPDGQAVLVNALHAVARVAVDGTGVVWRDLGAPHQGAALSPDGRRLWIGRPVDGNGGSVLGLDATTLETLQRTTFSDISPFVVAVR